MGAHQCGDVHSIYSHVLSQLFRACTDVIEADGWKILIFYHQYFGDIGGMCFGGVVAQ